ncbi:MAG: hypothetical protein WAV11_02075 [Minisyncoccia bacterium]
MTEHLYYLDEKLCLHLGIDANTMRFFAFLLILVFASICFLIYNFAKNRKFKINQIRYFGRLLTKKSEEDDLVIKKLIAERLICISCERCEIEKILRRRRREYEELAIKKHPEIPSDRFKMISLTIKIFDCETELKRVTNNYEEALNLVYEAGFDPEKF